MTPKILDCTLRDGGYYTNWDFEEDLVRQYTRALGRLPIDTLEVGYRNPPAGGYNGQYYHLSRHTLEIIRKYAGPKVHLGLMIDAKSCQPDHIASQLQSCKGCTEMIRIALDPAKIDHGLELAKVIKDMGFEVSINLMYMHRHSEYSDLFAKLARAKESVDWVYLVDSFGSCFPNQVGEAIRSAKAKLPQRIGFHGHDNLHLAFANTLAAIDSGVDILDCTVLGMGRGAGNLKTELLLAYLNHMTGMAVDLSELAVLLELFHTSRDLHRWGTNLPYMISGLEHLPQKKVMQWLGMKRYSTCSIIHNLQGQSDVTLKPHPFPMIKELKPQINPKYLKTILVIGGGTTVHRHAKALEQFVVQEQLMVIHCSLRNIPIFANLDSPQLVCLAGDEGRRIADYEQKDRSRILAYIVSPRSGIEELISHHLGSKVFQVFPPIEEKNGEDGFIKQDAPLNLVLKIIETLKPANVMVAGFDGYEEAETAYNTIAWETQQIFNKYLEVFPDIPLLSLTPTKYKLKETSVHTLIQEV